MLPSWQKISHQSDASGETAPNVLSNAFLSPFTTCYFISSKHFGGTDGSHPVPTQPHSSDFNEEYHNLVVPTIGKATEFLVDYFGER